MNDTISFYEPTSARWIACASCGCMVDASERGRTLHARSHEAAEVLDLTEPVAVTAA